MHNFYSDTTTKPTRAMREVALHCEVGDEQQGEDPTTSALCARVATLLGKEAAVFLPSGTMCNAISVNLHTHPSDEIIAEQSCHIINSESGGPAAISGVMIRPIQGVNGVFSADQVLDSLRPSSRHTPRSALLCVEQTANFGGGTIWPLQKLEEVAIVAKEAGLATHMDGARLMNAVVKTGIEAAQYAANFDSVWIDFSKGLGAPVGAVLAGSEEFIARAWRLKQMLGGGMRQSGVIASMCLYALDHHVDRLAADHELAASLGAGIAKLPLVSNVLPVETNIVIFDLADEAPSAAELVDGMRKNGVIIGTFGANRIRVVTHLDVDMASGEALMRCLRKYLV
jgi:threonine aldolase